VVANSESEGNLFIKISSLEKSLKEIGVNEEWIMNLRSVYSNQAEYLRALSNKQVDMICQNYERDDL